MVFCLCSGRRCFSKTLVINSASTSGVYKEDRRQTYLPHTTQLNGGPKSTAQVSVNTPRNLETIELSKKRPLSSESPQVSTHLRPLSEEFDKVVTPTSPSIRQVDNRSPKRPQSNDQEDVFTYQKHTDTSKNDKFQEQLPPKEHQAVIIQENEYTYEEVDILSETSSTGHETVKIINDDSPTKLPVLSHQRTEVTYQDNEETRNGTVTKQTTGTKTNNSKSSKKDKAPAVPSPRSPNSPVNISLPALDQNITENENNETSSSIDVNSPKPSIDTPKLSIELLNISSERREGVAPIPVNIDQNLTEKLPVYIKDPSDEELIKTSIEKNDFLNKVISGEQLKDVIAAMYNKEISAKETIVKQGDKGQHMYVSAKGTFNIILKGKVVGSFNDVRVFGELAILYNAKRLATIKAVTSGRVWVLDSNVYQQIMLRHNIKKEDEIQNFLTNNEYLNVLSKDVLQVVSTLLKSEFFQSGQTIIRQGDRGDKFFIIRAGTVTITKEGEGVVGVYKKGDCFGELALLEEDSRQATVTANAPGVECLTLTRKEFIDHFGEIKQFKYVKIQDKPKDSIRSLYSEFDNLNLGDLRIIKTLGVGGFGRVELVQHTKDESLVFALKYLKKIAIVEQNQQEHVYNEKTIQMDSRSPFIARLYKTFKDRKYIYFLMESCLGGDLWSLLQKQKNRRFEEKEARFICACVLSAFEYLHSRSIIYRDLKPENLLIAVNGYIKLIDFGFAKKITARGKTYTFAGTPEYVAPEIVLNRGHDRAVDYWAFGAFIFEMLSGRTPFRTDDSSQMRTYNKILSGIDNIQFPTYINLKARHLIEKLCRPVPSERLGMQRHGIQDIKNHKWFIGLDWQKLLKLEIPSPFKPKLSGPIDTKYFDHFKRDTDNPPDELSGWDEKF